MVRALLFVEAELAWLVDPQRTLYPISGHVSTIDQAYIRESPPAIDRHSNRQQDIIEITWLNISPAQALQVMYLSLKPHHQLMQPTSEAT